MYGVYYISEVTTPDEVSDALTWQVDGYFLLYVGSSEAEILNNSYHVLHTYSIYSLRILTATLAVLTFVGINKPIIKEFLGNNSQFFCFKLIC